MEYFTKITQPGLSDIIASTKKSLFLCLPSLHDELASALSFLEQKSDNQGKKVEIHILVDFDSNTFRQGYGNIDAVNDLITGSFDVRCLKDNRISFVISDDIGYYLFIESRSLIPADKETINAIKIDPVSIVRLKHYFFPDTNQKSIQDELVNAVIEESVLLKNPDRIVSHQSAPIAEIDENLLKTVHADLKENPPLNPDFKRTVEFYSNKFQYAKLEFKGANLMHRKLDLPPKALPIMDALLKKKLETKLKLFDEDDEDECFKPLNDYKTEINKLRETFLTKVKSRDESILDKKRKSEFEKQLKELEKGLESVKLETISNLGNQINDTKKRLLKDLTDFFIANPQALFPSHPNLWQNNDAYVKDEAATTAEEVIFKIKWPKAHLLLDEFKLVVQYSDITFENLKDENFISEIMEAGLIEEKDVTFLADFAKGIKV